MRASQFITEAMDSDAVNELDSFIMNDEDLYRRRFMPIISNKQAEESRKKDNNQLIGIIVLGSVLIIGLFFVIKAIRKKRK